MELCCSALIASVLVLFLLVKQVNWRTSGSYDVCAVISAGAPKALRSGSYDCSEAGKELCFEAGPELRSGSYDCSEASVARLLRSGSYDCSEAKEFSLS